MCQLFSNLWLTLELYMYETIQLKEKKKRIELRSELPLTKGSSTLKHVTACYRIYQTSLEEYNRIQNLYIIKHNG